MSNSQTNSQTQQVNSQDDMDFGDMDFTVKDNSNRVDDDKKQKILSSGAVCTMNEGCIECQS